MERERSEIPFARNLNAVQYNMYILNRYAIVKRQHNSEHSQVARKLGQDSFLYQEGNQNRRRKEKSNEKKRLIG